MDLKSCRTPLSLLCLQYIYKWAEVCVGSRRQGQHGQGTDGSSYSPDELSCQEVIGSVESRGGDAL